jgi:hypothetical protein
MKIPKQLAALCLAMALIASASAEVRRVNSGLPGRDLDDSQHATIAFDNNTEEEHMRNLIKVSEDLKVYEEEYSACIKEIPDEEYCEDKIDECVGKNFIKVVLDIKYETLKTMARADTKIRQIFIRSCYEAAGTNEEFSVGCDNMERDTLDLTWNGLDFVQLLEINRDKYLTEYGKVPAANFKQAIDELTDLSKELFQILDEIDAHKEVTILRLKTLIDDRTKLLLEEAKLHPDMIKPATIHHTIEITEQISGGDPIKVHELPTKQSDDMETSPMFARKIRQTHNEALNRLQQNHNERQTQASRIGYQPAAKKAAREDESRLNSSRVFNSGNLYSGLHAKHNSGKLSGSANALRIHAMRNAMGAPVKSVRTSHGYM